jgi:hypothetical protein
MALRRSGVCESAAGKLADSLPKIHTLKTLIGLDGFVDEIVDVVDRRLGEKKYQRVRTIGDMGRKVLGAAGQSCNYELVVKQSKVGGSGPIMAGALAAAGVAVTCIGSLGEGGIHPVFSQLAKQATLIGIAAPGHTQALEFEDGKVMLNKTQSFWGISWESLVAGVGLERLKRAVAGAGLIAMNNWTMIPGMTGIWENLAGLAAGLPLPKRKFFADLSDPEKRTRGDLASAMDALGRMQNHVDVILGLNMKEAVAVAEAVGAGTFAAEESAMLPAAEAIRKKLNLSCVVVHPRGGAAAATGDESAQIAGPFVNRPAISTGAGDHFNAGFCLGRMLEMSLEESLCLGAGCSGYYVRYAKSPGTGELAEFVERMPEPEE